MNGEQTDTALDCLHYTHAAVCQKQARTVTGGCAWCRWEARLNEISEAIDAINEQPIKEAEAA